MNKYLHWYEAFWGKAQKQTHEGLGPKWTISCHCGDMWCPESQQMFGRTTTVVFGATQMPSTLAFFRSSKGTFNCYARAAITQWGVKLKACSTNTPDSLRMGVVMFLVILPLMGARS